MLGATLSINQLTDYLGELRRFHRDRTAGGLLRVRFDLFEKSLIPELGERRGNVGRQPDKLAVGIVASPRGDLNLVHQTEIPCFVRA